MSQAEFAVFAPALTGTARLEFDVIALQFAELRDPTPAFANALVRPFGPIRCRELAVVVERCAYHAQPVPDGVLEDRFPLTWRCRAVVIGRPRLDPADDGPFGVEGWEPQFADDPSSSEWPGWPADIVAVGGFAGAEREMMDDAREALAGGDESSSRLSVVRTGAGIDLVRARLRVASPEEVEEIVAPVLAAFESAGAFTTRDQHVGHLLAHR